MADQSITINPETMQEVGENLKATKHGKYLILAIDTTVEPWASKSGRMDLIASTGGFSAVPGSLRANINIGTK